MLERFIDWLLQTLLDLGYPGIVALMAMESSILPVPSELVMPPAGYRAAVPGDPPPHLDSGRAAPDGAAQVHPVHGRRRRRVVCDPHLDRILPGPARGCAAPRRDPSLRHAGVAGLDPRHADCRRDLC